MTTTDDTARFAPGDGDSLVTASLMCPFCLHRPTRVLVNDGRDGALAVCACAQCQTHWTVGLDRQQALQLFAAPPAGLWIRHRFVRDGA